MTLNILGVGIAATFELVVTLLAIFELLVFMGRCRAGILLEPLTLAAGRARRASAAWRAGDVPPSRSLSGSFWRLRRIDGRRRGERIRSAPFPGRGGILTDRAGDWRDDFAGGVGDWRTWPFTTPLPQAMKMVVGNSSGWLHMLVW